MKRKSNMWKRLIAWMLVSVLLVQGAAVSAAEDTIIMVEEEWSDSAEAGVDASGVDTSDDVAIVEEDVLQDMPAADGADLSSLDEDEPLIVDEEVGEEEEALSADTFVTSVVEVDEDEVPSAATFSADADENEEPAPDTVEGKVKSFAASRGETVLFVDYEEDQTNNIMSAGACYPAVGSTFTMNVGDRRGAILQFWKQSRTKKTSDWSKVTSKSYLSVSAVSSDETVIQPITGLGYGFQFLAVGEGDATVTINYTYNPNQDKYPSYGISRTGEYTYRFQVGATRSSVKAGNTVELTGGSTIPELQQGIKTSSWGRWNINPTNKNTYDIWNASLNDDQSVITIKPIVYEADDGTIHNKYTVFNYFARCFKYIYYAYAYPNNDLAAVDYGTTSNFRAYSTSNSTSTSGNPFCDEFVVDITPYDDGLYLTSTDKIIFENEDSDKKQIAVHAYSGGERNKDGITWESSDTGVATVNDGEVTPVAPGTATIKASWNGYSVSVSVVVKGISVELDAVELSTDGENTTKTVSFAVYDEDGVVEDPSVTWSNTNNQVASVATDGTITAKSPGSTTITATWVSSNGTSYSKTINVEVEGSGSFVLSPSSVTMKVGDEQEITANASYNSADGSVSYEKPAITWATEDDKVATVDDGIITATGVGNTVITAEWTCPGNQVVYRNQVEVTVVYDGLYLSSDKVTVEKGGRINVVAIAYNMGEQVKVGDLYSDDDKAIQWTADDSGTVSVTKFGKGYRGGLISGQEVGTGYVTATWTTAKGVTYNKKVEVTVEENEPYIFPVDSTLTIPAMSSATGEHKWYEKSIDRLDYSEASEYIDLTAEGNSVNVQGLLPTSGKWVMITHMYYVDMAGMSSAVATYEEFAVQVTAEDGLYLDSYNSEVKVGSTDVIHVTVYSGNQKISDPAFTFECDHPEIADVYTESLSSMFTIKGVKPGTATVTVTYGNWEKNVSVTVAGDNGIYLDQSKVVLMPEETAKIEALVWYDGQQVTDASVNWRSTDEAVASVATDGTITAVGAGTTSVIARWTSDSGYYEATVKVTVRRTRDLTVEKVWDDGDDCDLKRPDSVSVQLKDANGNLFGEPVALNEENSWTYTWKGLEYYISTTENSGSIYSYEVEEVEIPERYTAKVSGNRDDGYTITNTYIPDGIDICATVSWNDAENQDGLRPEYVHLQLLSDGTASGEPVIINASDNWSRTWTVNKNNQGKEIAWSVAAQDVPEGYIAEVTGDVETGYTVTYTHTPETLDLNVSVAWDDENNQDAIRPDSVKVALKANGEATGSTITLEEANNWAGTFENVPKYNAGEIISYTLEETDLPNGYHASVESTSDGFKITNRHVPGTVNIKVSKVWQDADDQDGLRPSEIKVELYADGDTQNKIETLNKENGWSATFVDLQEKKNGTAIQYTVKEISVPTGYSSETSGDAVNGYVITNTHEAAMTTISVQNVWDDADNQDGKRIAGLTAELYADGQPTGQTVTFGTSDKETKSFTVEKNKDGKAIVYTLQVKSNQDEDVYAVTVIGNADNGFVVTNVHKPEKITVNVKNSWNDADNQDGIRKAGIMIRLYANGADTGKTREFTSDNEIVSFDVDRYAAGTEIKYEVRVIDSSVPTGYTTSVSGNVEKGFAVLGTHIPETVTISVKGIWDDSDNEDGKRTDIITVELYADGIATGKLLKLSASNEWSDSFSAAKYKAHGIAVKYTVTEIDAPAEYKVSVSGDAQSGYKLTNSYTPVEKTFTLKLSKNTYTYNGEIRTPSVGVYVAGKKLSNQYYTVTYTNNKNAGTAQVTVIGKDAYKNYSGTASFTINPKAFKLKLSKTTYTYNKKAKKPVVAVYAGSKKVSKKYYTVSYKNNKNVGFATVTVTGKGSYKNYAGNVTFKINPAKPKSLTLKSSKTKTLTMKWKKASQITGYQLQYSTSKNFKSKKTKTITRASTISYTAKNLKSKKVYYVRIRTYTKSKDGTVYSQWSSVKKVTIK